MANSGSLCVSVVNNECMGLLVSEIGEFGLIERLGALPFVRGIGDDCAVLSPPPGMDLVMTADALIEGVHFRHEWTNWMSLGGKAVGVNFSDIASMGAEPAGIVITLGLKPTTEAHDVIEFYLGMMSFLSAKVPVIGGDIVASPTATAISVTAYGYVPHGKAIRRRGARVGDDLWVTGTLGDSAAGLRLLQMYPERYSPLLFDDTDKRNELLVCAHIGGYARLREGQALAATGHVHAMMDLSDGLAGDLGHMVQASKVGAVIQEPAIPLSEELREASAEYGWDSLDLALHGGEDYELLIATSPRWRRQIESAIEAIPGSTITRIGTVVEGSGITLRRADGTEEALEAKAFTHF